MCHDVIDLSYDNDLYNRTRLSQRIEPLSRNRKKTTKFELCEKKSLMLCKKSYQSPSGKTEDQNYILSKET